MAAKENFLSRFRRWWLDARKTSAYRNILIYFVFVGIAFLFWLILSLNNNMQSNMTVNLKIYNVPDSITFLTDPPADFHLVVRDKGTSLLRNGAIHAKTLQINFKEYAHDGKFRFSANDLNSALRNMYGNSAQIASVSLDSIVLDYTDSKGRSVPVKVIYDVTTANGKTLVGKPLSVPPRVRVFSNSNVVDTLTCVYTSKVIRRNMTDSEEISVMLSKIPGVKIVPQEVKVKIDVEAMVSKSVKVPVSIIGLPKGESAMIYPDKVDVSYFVPMTYFNQDNDIKAEISYFDMIQNSSLKVPVKYSAPKYCINLSHLTDSVEVTLIK